MAKYTGLEKEPIISQWLDIIRKKPKTVHNYIMGFQKYMEFTGLTSEELLTEAEEEAAKQIIMRKRKILTRLLGFRKYLEANYAPLSVRNYINCVNSFYRAFYVEVPRLQGNRETEPMEENIRQITKDDIREVLTVADVLERAIVLTGVSSGLAMADIMNLKISDFTGGYDKETGITTLRLKRIKTGIKFCTFLSPEASNAVLDYLKYRSRTAQKGMHLQRRISQLEKQRIVSEDGYLFILRSISDDYLTTRDENLRKFNDESFNKLYLRLSEKAQKSNPNGYNTVRSHNMRKYFNSALINAGFDFYFVDHMLGHKADSTDRAYFWHDAEQLKERYKACIPHITIQKAVDVAESPEYQKLVQENQILATETARTVVERQELVRLKNQMDEMREEYQILQAEKLEAENVKIHYNEEEISKLVQKQLSALLYKDELKKRGIKATDIDISKIDDVW